MASTLAIAAAVSLIAAAIYVSAQILHSSYTRRRDMRRWEANRQAGNTPILEEIAGNEAAPQRDECGR